MNTWIRDTFIKQSVFDSLPADRQERIRAIITQFKGLGYIDARTEIGPDQYARMSEKRRQQISATASQVFRLEQEVKLLLRSNEQIVADEQAEAVKNLAEQKRRIEYRLKTIENLCSRRLHSKRENSTKAEYRELKVQLQALH